MSVPEILSDQRGDAVAPVWVRTALETALWISAVVGGTAGSILYTDGAVVQQYTVTQLLAAILAALPTSNPHVVGAWWLNGEVVSVSQG